MENTTENAKQKLDEISENVLMNHLTSFQNNDLEGVMSDFTHKSVLVTPEKTFTGLDEIRGFFAELILHFPKGKSTLELDKMVILEELIYIIWHAKTPSLEVPLASDTIIIEGGKIRKQTFVGELNFIN